MNDVTLFLLSSSMMMMYSVVSPYRRFRTTYWSLLQCQGAQEEFLDSENGINKLSWNVSKELPLYAA